MNKGIASIQGCTGDFKLQQPLLIPNTKAGLQSLGELNRRRAKASLTKILNPSGGMALIASPTMLYLEEPDNL